MNSFSIDLSTLPEEGKLYSGKLDQSIFDLPEKDSASPNGPLEFELYAKRFETELLLQGSLKTSMLFTCVRCLKKVPIEIVLDQAAIAVEIKEEGELDLTESIREEVVIEFPSYPNCDDVEPPEECLVNLEYFAVDKGQEDGVKTPPPEETSSEWSALDALSDLPKGNPQ